MYIYTHTKSMKFDLAFNSAEERMYLVMWCAVIYKRLNFYISKKVNIQNLGKVTRM